MCCVQDVIFYTDLLATVNKSLSLTMLHFNVLNSNVYTSIEHVHDVVLFSLYQNICLI